MKSNWQICFPISIELATWFTAFILSDFILETCLLVEKQFLHWDWTFNNVKELWNCCIFAHQFFFHSLPKYQLLVETFNLSIVSSYLQFPVFRNRKTKAPRFKFKMTFYLFFFYDLLFILHLLVLLLQL
jgi:hypothetical protein